MVAPTLQTVQVTGLEDGFDTGEFHLQDSEDQQPGPSPMNAVAVVVNTIEDAAPSLQLLRPRFCAQCSGAFGHPDSTSNDRQHSTSLSAATYPV
ncbi:hypothetical protein GJAV_G00250940 [Gymnothorax javanicus]|nr:hypothetical protein GJAV_G00250940 [Gymnothorax javanicus]